LADTFLPPIEQPQGLLMKLAYYFIRRQFGKVLTPLKVHSARLPPGFGLFYAKISKLDEKLQLPQAAGFAYSRTSGADQRLSVLHRYRQIEYDQEVDE